VNNPLGIRDSLRQNFYRYPALVPPMTWIDSIPPRAPTEIASGRDDYSVWLSWLAPEKARDGDTARNYVVYRFRKNEPRNLNDATKILAVQAATSVRDMTAASGETYTYIITALDKLSNESAPSREMVIEVK
jgi:fibronectin type 3 domain-containing protein